jgi:ectoine hydroxylase-related dioxygenase (phytanoyl-CoA dioxygenase family)
VRLTFNVGQKLMSLNEKGYATVSAHLAPEELCVLRDTIFKAGEAGKRCLLDEPTVRRVAIEIRKELSESGFLADTAVAVQAIAFDKTPSANWKVTWHQDLMFPFASPPTSERFDLQSRKEGIDYARPPKEVLEEMLAVRLHLDDCDATNGPLRISPGSHHSGILKSTEISVQLAKHGELTCLAKEGQALLMKPLILHASSQATTPKHRRVLHIVYHSGSFIPEKWHRSI